MEPFHAFKAVVLRVLGLSLLAWAATAIASRPARPGAQAWAAAAWVAAVALSTAFSLAPRLSWLGEPSQREGLLTALALAGLHLGSRLAHRDESQVRTTLTVMLGAGAIAAAYAQLQLAGLDPIPWQGTHTYATAGALALRPAGPLGNPILLGAVLATVLPVALVRLASARGDAARLVPAAALVAASLIATLSRGAWLAAAAAAAVGLGFAWRAGARPQRIAWTAALSLAPAILFGAARAWVPIAQRFAESVSGEALSTRELIARTAVRLWSERPLWGVGPDAFGLAFPRVQDPAFWRAEWVGIPVHAHSVPLQVLATLGLAGALAGLAWIVAAAIAWRRAWRAVAAARFTLAAIAGSLVALAVAGATNVVGLAGASAFAVLTALIPALEERGERSAPEPGRAQAALPIVVASLAFAITLVLGLRELEALALAGAAREAPTRDRLATESWRAAVALRSRQAWAAAELEPGEESLWRLACDASLAEAEALPSHASGASLAAAEQAARRALALVPVRAASHERLASALAARALRTGEKPAADSADASFERACRLAPADGWLLVSWIRFQLARRDGARAQELAQRLVALYPGAAVGHALSGAALLLLGRPDEARAELVRAQGARWEEDAGAQRAEVDRLVAELGRQGAGGRPGR